MKHRNKRKTEGRPAKAQPLPASKPEGKQSRPITLEQIEERLNNTILASSLALKVLKGVRKPTSQLFHELLEIEFQVGHSVGEAMKMHIEQMRAINLKGTLANALSTIPLGPPRDVPPAKAMSKARKRKKSIRRGHHRRTQALK